MKTLKIKKITPLIKKALDYATEKHLGQSRKFSGEPYIVHPMAVAELANKYDGYNEDKICAALLHDVVEDCNVSVAEIAKEFNSHIAGIVKELTSNKADIESAGKTEYMKKHMVNMSKEALTIKLADRLNNMMDNPTQKMKDATIEIINYLMANRTLSFPQKNLADDIMDVIS